MLKKARLVFIGLMWVSGCRISAASLQSPVFSTKKPDIFWLETVENLQGETLDEKSQVAMTTLEMIAVGICRLYRLESELNALAMELLELQDTEGRALFIQTHEAWRKYVDLQSQWITDDNRGGSARPIFSCIEKNEAVSIRIQLYREVLDKMKSAREGQDVE